MASNAANNKLLSRGKGVFAALAIICRFFWHSPGENNPGKDNYRLIDKLDIIFIAKCDPFITWRFIRYQVMDMTKIDQPHERFAIKF